MEITTTPTKSFAALNLSAETLSSLDQMGYKAPTDVQFETVPRAISGKDLVVQSRTGTGKTSAFGIPMVEKIDTSIDAIQAVVLAPTRELAIQVAEEITQLGRAKGVKVVSIYGGDSMDRQLDEIRGGAQVVAGTPGRVLDHLRRGTLNLDGLKVLVLDEADEMLSMGFLEEITEIIKRGQSDGTFRPDFDAVTKAVEILAFINGMETLWLLDPSIPLAGVFKGYAESLGRELTPRSST